MNSPFTASRLRLLVPVLLCVQGSAGAQTQTAPLDAPLAERPLPSPGAGEAGPAAVRAYAPAPLSPQQRELQRRLSLRHYALMGVAGMLSGGGLYFGAKSRSSIESAGSARYQGGAQDSLRTARTQAIVANAAFVGAGAAVVGAVVTYFISPPTPAPVDGGASRGLSR